MPVRHEVHMTHPRIRSSFAVLLIALSLSSCQKAFVVSPAATVNIKKNGSNGCTITIPVLGSTKDPVVSAGWFSGKSEKLTFSTDKADKDDYQVSFNGPEGSPLDQYQNPLIHGGGIPQSYSVRFLSAACLRDCPYRFEIYDTHHQKCDPIVHVTK